MSDDVFDYHNKYMWEIIEDACWGKFCKTKNTRQIKALWWKKRSWYIIQASLYAKTCANILTTKVNQYEKEHNCRCGRYGGDDSFNDMIWHVVGLGYETFCKIMKDPSLLNDIESVESFYYIMINDGHTEQFDILYHQNVAYECLGRLYHIKISRLENVKNSHFIKELEQRFLFILDNKVEDACGDFKCVDRRQIPDIYSRYVIWDHNEHGTRFSNALYDACNYLLTEE